MHLYDKEFDNVKIKRKSKSNYRIKLIIDTFKDLACLVLSDSR
jgi:hypothetical protein